jgi:hypothetical protein
MPCGSLRRDAGIPARGFPGLILSCGRARSRRGFVEFVERHRPGPATDSRNKSGGVDRSIWVEGGLLGLDVF